MAQKETTQEKLPAWTFDDAYGSVSDERFLNERKHVVACIEKLKAGVPAKPTIEDVIEWMPVYDDAFDGASSLISFSYCACSQNLTDIEAMTAFGGSQSLMMQLEAAGASLFAILGTLSDEDPAWENAAISHWKFVALEKKNSWKSKLNETQRRLIDEFAATNFYPMDAQYKRLNKTLKVQVVDGKGQTHDFKQSQCMSVLKGVPDPVLRSNTQDAMNAWYEAHAQSYVDILNAMHGFRSVQFKEAGVDWLTPSLEQNRMSKEAIEALLKCVYDRREELQEAIRLRAPYFGSKQMKTCDLLAPVPGNQKATGGHISHPEAMEMVKKALVAVSPELPAFIDMMLEKHWLEARVDPNKAGGAFYSRFNRLKQTRVFSTYMGSFSSVIMQAHELGHAFHYWVMRDLPTVQTEFPMTLTEVASTFNEANLRHYRTVTSQSDEERFTILWQELNSVANFCLNQPVRMEFEERFIRIRQERLVTPEDTQEIIEAVWRKWYGDATVDTDPYIWAYKPHFFMTDQYIYNYAYMVGYLISQGLRKEQEKRGDAFPAFYREFLRDTGRMTLDDLIRKHMGMDPAGPDFWNQCLDVACSYIAAFKEVQKKLSD